jgi:hypothetical protein
MEFVMITCASKEQVSLSHPTSQRPALELGIFDCYLVSDPLYSLELISDL